MVIIVHITSFRFLRNFSGKEYYNGEYYNNHISFFKNGCLHRYYGPARIWTDKDGDKYWHFNDEVFGCDDEGYNQKQFIKDIKRLWLL